MACGVYGKITVFGSQDTDFARRFGGSSPISEG